jgi:benzoate-CoA ligase family protein
MISESHPPSRSDYSRGFEIAIAEPVKSHAASLSLQMKERGKKVGTASQGSPQIFWLGAESDNESIRDPRLSLPREYNAASYFIDRHVVEGRAGRIAFADDNGTYSYGDLAARVNRAGNVLRSLGVGAEDRVLLCLLDTFDFPALFWGAIKIGAVPVPISTMLRAADYDYLLRDCAAKVVAVSAELQGQWTSVAPAYRGLRAVLVTGKFERDCGGLFQGFDTLVAQADPHLECEPCVPDSVALWLYSSGSTGKPKAAVHLHSHLIHTAVLNGEMTLGIGENDVVFSGAKLFFAYGLGNASTFPLHAGATSVLMAERSTPEAVMAAMRRHRITVFFGVPTLYANILAHPELDRSAGSDRLRLCVSAGEALPENISQRWAERFGVEILDGIGSTESLHTVISNRRDDFRYGTSGKPVPGWEIRLLNEQGREVAPSETGDLWCSGPSISPYYWNDRETSRRTFVGRWLRTGDKYQRDADGYYRYIGRSGDMMKAGGIWVSPFEVESLLITHPAVLQAAMIGVADSNGLAKPKAFVVLRAESQGTQALADTLIAYLRERLAHFKCPRSIEFRAELPMTATGKIQRYKLREEASRTAAAEAVHNR